MRFVRETRTGHVVIFLLVFSLPQVLFFLHEEYLDGSLTLVGSILTCVLFALGGAILGLIAWYTMPDALRKR